MSDRPKPDQSTRADSGSAAAPLTTIYTVIFGVSLALGGSALEPFPLFSVTFASPLVALLVTLDKLVVNTRFSVTAMYAIVVPIAIFTTYLGPPSPLKVLFILAGLSFDAGTLFRTGEKLRLRHLLLGHAAITVTGFFFFWIVFVSTTPGIAREVGYALLVAAPLHYIISVVVATAVYAAVTRGVLKQEYGEIRTEIEADRDER